MSSASVSVVVPGPQTFTSPGYPAPYPNNSNVDYVITAPEGYSIQFHADVFDLEGPFDTLNFTETHPVHGKVLLGTFDIAQGITTLQSTTNEVRATFHSDSSGGKSGFHVSAWSVPPHLPKPIVQVVPIAISADNSRSLKSPNFPSQYETNLLINYVITAPHGTCISLQAETYELSQRDTLIFSEFIPEKGYVTIGSFWRGHGQTLKSTTNNVIASFRSDKTSTDSQYSGGRCFTVSCSVEADRIFDSSAEITFTTDESLRVVHERTPRPTFLGSQERLNRLRYDSS